MPQHKMNMNVSGAEDIGIRCMNTRKQTIRAEIDLQWVCVLLPSAVTLTEHIIHTALVCYVSYILFIIVTYTFLFCY